MLARPPVPGRGGFSLLEVLIVVTILAVVVGGVYGIYETSVENARNQQMRANQKIIQLAIEQYKAKTNRFPSSLEALTRGYLNRVPDDPTTAYSGNDWLVIGPNDNPRSVTSWRPATSPPSDGIFDVRSRSEL
jgi:general secretion pathway protein G